MIQEENRRGQRRRGHRPGSVTPFVKFRQESRGRRFAGSNGRKGPDPDNWPSVCGANVVRSEPRR
jgi:hypothetical protein